MRALFLGGAGFIGTPAVEDLVATSDFAEIVLGDNDLKKAEELVSRLNDKRLSTRLVDVTKEDELVETMRPARSMGFSCSRSEPAPTFAVVSFRSSKIFLRVSSTYGVSM